MLRPLVLDVGLALQKGQRTELASVALLLDVAQSHVRNEIAGPLERFAAVAALQSLVSPVLNGLQRKR
jgi:hypothetical protein